MSPLERDLPWKKLNFNQKRLELKNHNSKLKSNHSQNSCDLENVRAYSTLKNFKYMYKNLTNTF